MIKDALAPVHHERADKPALFQVWIDLGCGIAEPDWWWNSPPKPLPDALEEAAKCRSTTSIPAKVFPEGVNPRPDGRWDNP
jgi:hypothetical protein